MEDITIKKNSEDGYYTITQGKLSSCELSFDEAFGLLACLLVPEGIRPCLQWMKTAEQHKAQEEYFKSLSDKNGT